MTVKLKDIESQEIVEIDVDTIEQADIIGERLHLEVSTQEDK